MSRHYPICQSRLTGYFLNIIYGLAILAVISFISSIWLIVLLSLLLGLWLLVEFKALKSEAPDRLILNPQNGKIDVVQKQQHCEFEPCKLFSNRWFLILQLKNEDSNRNLLLLADRFNSLNEYLQFRYQVINMNSDRNAT